VTVVITVIPLLSDSYKIHSNFPLSRLSPYVDEVIGDHQYGFLCNRSTTDQIFCICQILEKKWDCSATVHQLFIHFKIQLGGKLLYSIVIEFGAPIELGGLIRMLKWNL
jgi:hypothetical protein